VVYLVLIGKSYVGAHFHCFVGQSYGDLKLEISPWILKS
jgi:hypothetical protein